MATTVQNPTGGPIPGRGLGPNVRPPGNPTTGAGPGQPAQGNQPQAPGPIPTRPNGFGGIQSAPGPRPGNVFPNPGPGIQSAPVRGNQVQLPTVSGDATMVTIRQNDGQTYTLNSSELSKDAITNWVKTNYKTYDVDYQSSLVGRIFKTASTEEIKMTCGDNSTSITYNPNDHEDKAKAMERKRECKKANEEKDHEADINLQRSKHNRMQAKLSGLSSAPGGHVVSYVHNYFASVFTPGNGYWKTWVYLLAYMIILTGFVLTMWGIMTKGSKKYTTYKSIFFGLYVGSFLGIILDLIFMRPGIRNSYLESNYGGLFLIIIFTIMSLIMGWQGIYRMLKQTDDDPS